MTTPAGVEAVPTSPATGLTPAEAARRLAADGPNEVAARRPVRLYSRVLAQLRDPLIMVLLGAVALTLAIRDHPDAIVIGLVVLVNTTVGVVQEVRADNAVAALSALSAPHARVRRDGTVRDVAAAEIVVGDVLVLGEGDVVAADALLVEASALLLDESMLTGESVPRDKNAGDLLSAGTVVVHGRGVATTTATGPRSALGRIAALLDDRREATPLQRRLAALGRILAAVTLALCVLIFALGLVRGLPPGTMAVTAISLAVAAVPESLPAVVTLALALGARRMAARGTEVARQAADLVLTDDELTTVVSAVEEGRRVYDNIRRFLVYGMAGGAAEILVMLAGPLLGLPLPLRAGQILWINLLTHGLTGVAMGAEPAAPGTMRRPPRPPDQHILGGGAWQRLLVLAAVVTAASLGAGLAARTRGLDWQSVLFLALLAAQLGVVLGLRARLFVRENLFLPLSVIASALLALAALYVPFLRTALDTDPLGGAGLALAAACAPTGFLAARAVRTAFREAAPTGTDRPSGLP